MTGMLAMQTDRVWRRDRSAMVSGVCAGLAEDLDLPLPLVRLVAVLFLILPTGLAYLALSMLLRRGPVQARPVRARAWPADAPAEAPRAASSRISSRALSQEWALLRQRLDTLDPRLKRIEAFITSKEFELDRGFRRMGE